LKDGTGCAHHELKARISANTLGLTVLPALLASADKVVE
jgi:hypothetical protein